MPGNLLLKFSVTLIAVMVLAVSLAVWLNLLRFQETYSAIVEQRLDVALKDAHSDILIGLDLGLHPSGMEDLPDVLHRVLSIMPDTRSARVHDCDGRLIASAGTVGLQDPPWMENLGQPHWVAAADGVLAAGLELTDNIGDCAGALVVEMQTGALTDALQGVQARLLWGGGLSLLLLLPALGMVAAILRQRRAVIGHLSADLDAVAAGTVAATDPPPDTLDPRRGLTGGESRMIAAYRGARPALAPDPEARR